MIFPYKLKLVEAVSSIQLIERIYEWTPFDPLKPVQDFPLSAFLSECFQSPAVIEVTVVGSGFCFAR